jgi:hypothetical protein
MPWGASSAHPLFPGAAFGYETLDPAPERAIMTFILPGGQHAQTTWEREFALALTQLYRPGRSKRTDSRAPVGESVRYLSPHIKSK